jgi:hypothetical protein
VSSDFLLGLDGLSPAPAPLDIPSWLRGSLPALAALDASGQRAVKAILDMAAGPPDPAPRRKGGPASTESAPETRPPA